jgi:2-dehydro-3-deoxyphosphogluconate aldolase/(4S)-4-hydroxy-2-oxoglutarate aldolase
MSHDTNLMNVREEVIYLTKSTGVLPAIKLHDAEDLVPYAEAMVTGGIRVLEVTMTTPGVLEAFKAISARFGKKLYLAAGTCLDAATARAAIDAGACVIVSPAVIPEVIATANRYGVACYSGAFTATECLTAMQAGADMVKIFPAQLGGPKYMTNLKMVFPEVNLIPSGGISLETAGDFIRCGACAVSGARNFFDRDMVRQHGLGWISEQAHKYIQIVAEAKANPHR